jgi:hypothetical protein
MNNAKFRMETVKQDLDSFILKRKITIRQQEFCVMKFVLWLISLRRTNRGSHLFTRIPQMVTCSVLIKGLR